VKLDSQFLNDNTIAASVVMPFATHALSISFAFLSIPTMRESEFAKIALNIFTKRRRRKKLSICCQIIHLKKDMVKI
jgi:hypothetical protein